MAVTSKRAKGRIDFGVALDDAIYIGQDTGNQSEDNKEIAQKDETNKTEINIENETNNEREVVVYNNNIMETNSDQQDKNDAENIFLSLVKSDRGMQRSVYFESSVYTYVNSVAEKYGVNFSNVVNLLLKDSIERMK